MKIDIGSEEQTISYKEFGESNWPLIIFTRFVNDYFSTKTFCG